MGNERILITGGNGQIGSELSDALIARYGHDNVLVTDIKPLKADRHWFEFLDIMDKERLIKLCKGNGITQIYHLAAILSAKGELKPIFTWNVNMTGLLNVLEVAKDLKIKKVFFPSSIAVFGSDAESVLTPQHSVLTPESVYGITKVAGENWCNYYYDKFGVDVRSLRYPGIIGYVALPGGGTTDYAVEIYHEAIKYGQYDCFLERNSALPMIYMADAVRATIELMEAPKESIRYRTSYNLAGISFTPKELAAEIQKFIPEFKITYSPDPLRQSIADSWPDSLDDSAAQKDWNWNLHYDITKMTEDMLLHLRLKYKQEKVQ